MTGVRIFAQLAAVAAFTYLYYAMDAFNRYYFPAESRNPSVFAYAEFAAVTSLIWLAPQLWTWIKVAVTHKAQT